VRGFFHENRIRSFFGAQIGQTFGKKCNNLSYKNGVLIVVEIIYVVGKSDGSANQTNRDVESLK